MPVSLERRSRSAILVHWSQHDQQLRMACDQRRQIGFGLGTMRTALPNENLQCLLVRLNGWLCLQCRNNQQQEDRQQSLHTCTPRLLSKGET